MRGITAGAVLAFCVAAVGCTTNSTSETDETKTWIGYWDGNRQYRSTLDFQNGNQLRYCFQSECTTTEYKGDPKGTVRFNWGQAKFAFRWTGNGYRITRRADDTTNTGFLR